MGLIPAYKWKDAEDDVWQSLWRGAISEFVATLIFVFVGTGSVVATQATLGVSSVQIPSLTVIALAHGFAIMILVYAVGEISGGHINPAVTWATMITNKISVIRGLTYIVFQLLGGIIGSALLKSILPPELQYSMGCHGLNPKLSSGQGFGAEVIFTAIFLFVVFATAISPFAGKFAPLAAGGGHEYGPGKLTPFAVGMTILVLHCVGVPLTGASMNPARSFGPAVVNGCWSNHWIYWIGPLTGSTAASLICQAIFLNNPDSMLQILRINRASTAPKNSQTIPTNSQTTNPNSFALMKEDEQEIQV